MKKKVLLIGGKSKAKELAQSLVKKNYNVTIINNIYADCLKLSEIEGVEVINGDGSKIFILEEAGADTCDIAIALTSKDEDNLVICQLCKKVFHIKKTVSLLSDPKKIDFFYKMGIDSVVCAISAITAIIEKQAFVDEISNSIQLVNGHIKINEIHILENYDIVGKNIWQLNLPKEVIIGGILRGNNIMIPNGNTQILADDMLIVISGEDKEKTAIEKLTEKR